ncbi:hypothetical protein B0H19DRAFT_969846 [Mycena capillaripes]|nr:hypothetical protein B0H19DRAFT_969846 [Mycena capillaripes]
MFVTPGILLKEGTQHSFTQAIKHLADHPTRRSTAINLDRIRCSMEDEFGFQPTDSTIWTSMRSKNIHRLTRNFLWKCVHDIYHLGKFWERVPTLEHLAQCSACHLPESLEHIMLECDAPGQQQVWRLAKSLWQLRYPAWPKLNWGLLLGCALARFKSTKGVLIPAKNRFFTIVISTSMRLLWNLRNERLFQTRRSPSEQEIHNRWLSAINAALKYDQLITNKARFGSLAIKKPTGIKYME